MFRYWRMYALLTVFLLCTFTLPAHAFAATWYTNASSGSDTTGDGSSGNPYQTFIKAYTAASSGDTLNLTGTFDWSSAGETGDVSTSGFTISKSLIIVGSSNASNTIIQASSTPYTANRKIFTVSGSGVNVTFQNLTLRNGYLVLDNAASAVDISSTGKVAMLGVIVTQNANNSRFASGAVQVHNGAGIFTLRNSTFYNNGSTTLGSWPGYTGGIEFYNLTTTNEITNSTFYNNVAQYQGAILVSGTNVKLNLTNSTFINNKATVEASDILSFGSAIVYLKNDIFAKKQSGGSNNVMGQSTSDFVDDGYNIIETQTTAGFTNGTNHDLVGVQASLNIDTTPQTNSATSSVPTLALLSGSVAIDAGDASLANNGVAIPQSDERGLYRNGAVDMGAFEYNGSTTPVSDATPPSVSLTAPVDGSTIGATTTLSATASDTWGVAGVQFYVDGAQQGGEVTTSPYTASFNTATVSAGTHTVVAVARDTSNNYATSTTATVTVDNTKPVISAIATSTTSGTATVTWTTDKSSTSTISYGLTTGYGSASTSAQFVTSHSVTLTGLSANTTYHFKIGSADTYGNATTTGDYTLKTVALDTAPPLVALTAPVASEATSSIMTLAASSTDNVAVAGVTFYINGVKQGAEDISSPYAISYDTTATSSGTYTAFAVSRDTSNNYATSSVITFTISNPGPAPASVAAVGSAQGATVTWSTATAASSRIFFGPSTSYGSSTSESDTSPRVTSHSVVLAGLQSCALYHFKVTGADASLNSATSSDATFTTTGCTGGAAISATAQNGIATSTGGTLTQGTLTLTVPLAFTATSSSAVFEANQLDRTAFLAGAGTPTGVSAATSAVFNLKALTDATTTLSTFTAPLTVTLSYSPSDIADLVESSLKIYRYDSGTGWSTLPNCVVDTTAKTVTCNTSNFSDFAIFGTAQAVVQTTTTSSGGAGMIYGSSPLAPGYQVGAVALATQPAAAATPASSSTPYNFTRNLRQGSTGADVKALQQYLNVHGFTVATKGAGSAGSETSYYGPATAHAVAALQQANAAAILAPLKLTKGTGLFARATRAFVNSAL